MLLTVENPQTRPARILDLGMRTARQRRIFQVVELSRIA
jgi:hypothetical protein